MTEFLDVILLIVAGIIFYKLYNVLGKRPDGREDHHYYDIFSQNDSNKNKNKKETNEDKSYEKGDIKVLSPNKERNFPMKSEKSYKSNDMSDSIIEMVNPSDLDKNADFSAIRTVLEAVGKYDRYFNSSFFLNGAKRAYEQILSSFVSGDLEALKPLLSDKVYRVFEKNISEDKKKKYRKEFEFISIKDAAITRADLKGNMAKISVRFLSEIFLVTRDDKGNVVDGDPNHIQDVTDIWSFERDIKSKNPNWILCSTSAGS